MHINRMTIFHNFHDTKNLLVILREGGPTARIDYRLLHRDLGVILL